MTPYSTLIESFLDEIRDYKFLQYGDDEINKLAVGYMVKACAEFNDIYTRFNDNDLLADRDDENSTFLFELDYYAINVITTGMVVFWMTPYANNAENLENFLNTKDYSMNSTANLLSKVRDTYDEECYKFEQKMKEYSYRHGSLRQLHM